MKISENIYKTVSIYISSPFKVGILGCLLSLFAGSMFYAVSVPFTADSPLHLDYAWQISKGQLPNFSDGILAPIPVKSEVQYVSQHPPLYYLMIAPVAYFIDRGEYAKAMLAAKTITTTISLTCVLAYIWLGKLISRNNKKQYSLLLAGFATSLVPFIKVTGDVMNDSLALLFNILAVAMAVSIIRYGSSNKKLFLLSGIIAAGMATRATFITTALIVLFAIFVTAIIEKKETRGWSKKIWIAIKPTLITFCVVILTIGWFYYHNYKLSGHWYRSGPQNWVALAQGRKYKSFEYVITSVKFWTLMPTGFYGKPWKGITQIFGLYPNCLASIILFASSLFYGVYASFKQIVRTKQPKEIIIFLMLFILAVTPLILQLKHAVGYGAINFRYLLSAIVPISIFIVYALTETMHKLKSALNFNSNASAILLLSLTIINWTAVLVNTVWYINSRYGQPDVLHIESFIKITRINHISSEVLLLLIMGLCFGLVLQFFSLKKLNKAKIYHQL